MKMRSSWTFYYVGRTERRLKTWNKSPRLSTFGYIFKNMFVYAKLKVIASTIERAGYICIHCREG